MKTSTLAYLIYKLLNFTVVNKTHFEYVAKTAGVDYGFAISSFISNQIETYINEFSEETPDEFVKNLCIVESE